MKKLLLFMSLAFFVISGSSTNRVPNWFLNPYRISGYTAAEFFVGVGSGASLDESKNQAIADIQKQISVGISATQRTSVYSKTKAGQENYQEEIIRKTQSIIKGKLRNVRYIKNAEIAGVFFTAVALNKAEFLDSLKTELNKYYTRIGMFKETADNALEQNGNIDFYMSQMQKAIFLIRKIAPKLVLYNSISKKKYFEKVTSAALLKQLNSKKASIHLTVIKGSNQDVNLNKPSKGKIIIQAFSRDEFGAKKILKGTNIAIYYENGKRLGKFNTNDSGQISFNFYGFRFAMSKNSYYISAVPQISGAELWYARKNIFYNLTIPSNLPTISLKYNFPKDRNAALEQRLKNALTILGYKSGKSNSELRVSASLNEKAGLNNFSAVRMYILSIQFSVYKNGTFIEERKFSFDIMSMPSGKLTFSNINFIKTDLPEFLAVAFSR